MRGDSPALVPSKSWRPRSSLPRPAGAARRFCFKSWTRTLLSPEPASQTPQFSRILLASAQGGRLSAGHSGKIGAPGEIRTPDLLVRSQALYPTELRAHLSTRW